MTLSMAHGGPLKAPVITLGEKKVCLVKKRRPTNTSAMPSTAGRTPPARKAPANPLTASSLKNSSRRASIRKAADCLIPFCTHT